MIKVKKRKLNPWYLVAVFFAMLGLSFASVPLYDLFCRVTGFGGTTQKSTKLPKVIINKNISMRFDTNVGSYLPISFEVKNNRTDIKPGEVKNSTFFIVNKSDFPLRMVATFNVTPDSVGEYFNKIECFCFEQQTLSGKGEKEFNLSYYIDPEIIEDPATKNVKDITLSYTLFELDKFQK